MSAHSHTTDGENPAQLLRLAECRGEGSRKYRQQGAQTCYSPFRNIPAAGLHCFRYCGERLSEDRDETETNCQGESDARWKSQPDKPLHQRSLTCGCNPGQCEQRQRDQTERRTQRAEDARKGQHKRSRRDEDRLTSTIEERAEHQDKQEERHERSPDGHESRAVETATTPKETVQRGDRHGEDERTLPEQQRWYGDEDQCELDTGIEACQGRHCPSLRRHAWLGAPGRCRQASSLRRLGCDSSRGCEKRRDKFLGLERWRQPQRPTELGDRKRDQSTSLELCSITENSAWRSLSPHAPLGKQHNAVRTSCDELEIVTDEKGARTSGCTLSEELEKELTTGLIESTGRFVENKEQRLARDRGSERNQLALPTTEKREMSLGEPQETEARQRFPGSLLTLLRGESKLTQPERDFSQWGRMDKLMIRVLRHITNERCKFADRRRPRVLAGDEDATSCGMKSPNHLSGKRCLPGTVRSNNGDYFARENSKLYVT